MVMYIIIGILYCMHLIFLFNGHIMGVYLNIDELKKEHLGMQINWLTVIDIFRDDKTNRVMYKCRCKCGNIRIYTKKLLLGPQQPMSCGCYKRSDECCAKKKQTYIDRPELRRRASEQKIQYYKDHPELCKSIGDHNRELYNKEPWRRQEVGTRISKWYKDNPDKAKELGIQHSEWMANNPAAVKDAQEKRLQYLKDHPAVDIDRRRKLSDWAKNNPDKVDEIATKNRSIAAEKRRKRDFTKLLSFVHKDYIDDIINGITKQGDIIETLCPACNTYAKHAFNTRMKNGIPPLCKSCHVKLTSCFVSKYEQEIADYIGTLYGEKPIQNDRSILSGKELDLYYPEKKIAIEFNGMYWHDENHKPKDYHFNKFKLCRDKNIRLISVFEQDWKHKQDRLKSILDDAFSNSTNIIYARKCDIRVLDPKIKSDFINTYHFYGDANQHFVSYGLYYNDELLTVMSFCKERYSNRASSDNAFEIIRLCTKHHYIVVGGASKLFKQFIRDYNPDRIMCYSDNDFFTGNVYNKLGFTLKSLGSKSIDYQWCNETESLSRYQCMPYKLLDRFPQYNNIINSGEVMRSKEKYIMEDLGYFRVYRCGNSVWEWLKSSNVTIADAESQI